MGVIKQPQNIKTKKWTELHGNTGKFIKIFEYSRITWLAIDRSGRKYLVQIERFKQYN